MPPDTRESCRWQDCSDASHGACPQMNTAGRRHGNGTAARFNLGTRQASRSLPDRDHVTEADYLIATGQWDRSQGSDRRRGPNVVGWGNTGGKPMTWGQALTGLIVLTVVGAGIAYVVVWLRSHAFWAMSRHSIIRGQSSSHDPIVDDDVWRDPNLR